MQQLYQTLLITFAMVVSAGCSTAEDQLKRCLSDTPYQTDLFDAGDLGTWPQKGGLKDFKD